MLNNLLIVDDEYYTVEIIKNQYRWEELGIGQVFIAYSVTQAMSLVETQHIDVAICDIEMGSQNGLDLLAWLQKNHPYVVSFILSGHSQFEYCQKAIEFGSLNYVLKPIEYDQLRKVILTAVKKAEEQRARSLYIRQSENWERSSEKIVTQFWYDVISRTIPTKRTTILTEAAKIGISIDPDSRYLLLMYHWTPKNGVRLDNLNLRYALNNMAKELFENYVTSIPAILFQTDYCLLCGQKGPDALPDSLFRACGELKEAALDHFRLDMTFCLGQFQPLEKLPEQFRKVHLLFQKKSHPGATILTLENDDKKKYSYHKSDFQIWTALLEAGRDQEFMEAVREYLKECSAQNSLDEATLSFFQWDFHHLIATIAERHLLDFSAVENDEEQWHLSNLPQVEKSIYAVVQHLLDHLHVRKQPPSLACQAKAYIGSHLTDENISRNTVANYLAISPEYLSRVFKKEEGVSLLEYIQAQKMELACKFFQETALPISEVAARLGYSNFAYFSQIFRKATGSTPAAYRKAVGGKR